MRTLVAAMAAASALAFAAPAFADTIDFSQFGSEFVSFDSPANGLTTGGVAFTITAPGANGFERLDEGSGWNGIFDHGTPLIWDSFDGNGAMTIDFASDIASITHLGAQSNDNGGFTATLKAYDAGMNLLGSQSYNAVNDLTSEGTLPSFNFTAAGIRHLVISTTNDDDGFALGGVSGGGGVPEPAAWALMIGGFGLAGARLRRRSVLGEA